MSVGSVAVQLQYGLYAVCHLSKLAFHFMFKVVCLVVVVSSVRLACNVFGLCVRAGFGAQNCQPALNLNRSTKLQVCTSPRLTQNPCYSPFFLSFLVKYLVWKQGHKVCNNIIVYFHIEVWNVYHFFVP